ncbi:MAG: hypothetical protein Q7K71_05425 [Candidatus Omnitrophota bacterium]|nr:hypothetical protein [Candidatus Omnitrophota bacterium]
MSQENLGSKSFVAGTDLEAYRRVKLSSGNVVYADAGEEFIGVTARKALSGEFVAINLRSASRTYKMVANGAITAGNTIYGALGGKVSASASGVAQGVALEAATADGDIIECFQNNGVAGAIDGASTAIGDPTINGSVPVIFAKQGITDATTTPIIVTAPYKFRIINWWIISRDTTAANVKLVNVATDASAVKAKGTTNDAIVLGGDIINSQKDVLVTTALKVNASAVAAFDIFVMAIKVT